MGSRRRHLSGVCGSSRGHGRWLLACLADVAGENVVNSVQLGEVGCQVVERPFAVHSKRDFNDRRGSRLALRGFERVVSEGGGMLRYSELGYGETLRGGPGKDLAQD